MKNETEATHVLVGAAVAYLGQRSLCFRLADLPGSTTQEKIDAACRLFSAEYPDDLDGVEAGLFDGRPSWIDFREVIA